MPVSTPLTPLPPTLAALLEELAHLSPRIAGQAAVAAELARSGDFSVFLVGGVVRDFVSGRESVDLDLVVEGDAAEFARRLALRLDGELRLHAAFQTAELTTAVGGRIDIATARRERYPGPAQLPVVEAAPLAEDLARRDFSINAMAISLRQRAPLTLIDPHSGHRDLSLGLLRVLHERSFIDDPTRILRAARFAVRLGLRLDSAGLAEVSEVIAAGVFARLSAARLRGALRLILADRGLAVPTLDLLAGWDVVEGLHPALAWGEREAARLAALNEAMEKTGETGETGAMARAPSGWEFALRLVGWVFDRSSALRRGLAERLQLAGAARSLLVEGPERIAEASRAILALEGESTASWPVPPQAASRVLCHLSDEELWMMIALNPGPVADWARREMEEMRRLKLTISGSDLLAMGFEPGRRVGSVLQRIRDARLDKTITASEELLMARSFLEGANSLDLGDRR